jgi:hypothetical protein
MSVSVKRISDGKTQEFDAIGDSKVKDLKTKIKASLEPQYDHGCRLIYNGKVLKAKQHLKKHGITGNNELIEMHDEKDWASSEEDEATTK